jgi:uncharacterized radical SAM protein YgiQ
MNNKFLPISDKDLRARNWSQLDIILISGDAYVDHPSYGVALIGRVLEDSGFKVGIIAQPDWRKPDDFLRLGKPKLFFGISAGNLDSMVANYTANKKPRSKDDYSPGGKTNLRPDRAVIVYANKVREYFPGVALVIGGLEASLRRLAHYDYWANEVRRSILFDSRADILVYGMGERQILEISKRMSRGETLDNIKGTAVIRSRIDDLKDCIIVPSFEEVKQDKGKFNQAFKVAYSECDPLRGKTIVQKYQERYLIQFPQSVPLTKEELDKVYDFPYARSWHPVYNKERGIPGFETVRYSITSHRGCCGECSFCSLYPHQGRIVQSRSRESVIREAKILAAQKEFRGTITDIGGPTANLYAADCKLWEKTGACKDKRCLVPAKCTNLKLGYNQTLELWKEVMKIPGVKHLFIGSGVRYDLLIDKYSDEYLKVLCSDHVSGQLKVAPEHIADSVLDIMNKPHIEVYEKFTERFRKINKALNKKQYLVNYLISSHPGSDLNKALEMSSYLLRWNIRPEQVQDFIPLPMTLSGCIYYTGSHPFTGEKIYTPGTFEERKMHRALLQYNQPKNKKLIRQALKILGKPDLKTTLK